MTMKDQAHLAFESMVQYAETPGGVDPARIAVRMFSAAAYLDVSLELQLVRIIAALQWYATDKLSWVHPDTEGKFASMLEYFQSHLGELAILEKLDWAKIVSEAKLILSNDPNFVQMKVLNQLLAK